MGQGSSRFCKVGLCAVWVLAAQTILGGCGVWLGDPIELFTEQARGDGGVESDEPCIETALAVTGNDPTVIGASAYELVDLVTGDHSSTFLWGIGDNTRVTLSVEKPQVYSVVSRTNPRVDEPYSQRHCANHVRVDARVRLRTVDGRLNETFGTLSMIAFGAEEVRGSFTVAAGELAGTYSANLRGERCFASSTFRFLIARDGTHGSHTDALGKGACQADGGLLGTTPYAVGHWGARWQNY